MCVQAPALFPLHYWPAAAWFAFALSYEHIELDICQYYRKQQLFNRSYIRVPEGKLALIIPVARQGLFQPIKDTLTEQKTAWQRQHWRAIESAYRKAPYFEYYGESIAALYQQPAPSLAEFTQQTIELAFRFLQHKAVILSGTAFRAPGTVEADYRNAFEAPHFAPPGYAHPQYEQVFPDFVPGLSVLDMLFNEGPRSRELLLKV